MGFIDFTNGEVLTADQMDLVMRQGIMRFADATARDTALSAVLAEGMMAYLDDTDEVLKYDGTDWIDISGDITGVTAGTALTGGGTSGNVTLDVDESALTIAQSQVTDLVSDLADKQDDVITTQGDLIIGDASGDAVRLPVGAEDTVLTSDGTAVSWVAGGSGGGESFFTLPYQELATIDVDFQVGDIVRFAIISTSTSAFNITLLDSSGADVDVVTVDRDNPFTYYNTTTAIATIQSYQDVIDEEAILIFSDPRAANAPDIINTIVITSTQTITLNSNFTAYCFGGGGGGGGVNSAIGASGGGGGSGYYANGTVTAGTYTATIGSGGTGSTLDGTDGGTTSIGALSAAGGSGGQGAPNVESIRHAGDGGNGGSGGGGGGQKNVGGSGGINGADGADGGNDGTSGREGVGGIGSGTTIPTTAAALFFGDASAGELYKGGGGGNAITGSVIPGSNASLIASGGDGGAAENSNNTVSTTGGDGADGYILLVEV